MKKYAFLLILSIFSITASAAGTTTGQTITPNGLKLNKAGYQYGTVPPYFQFNKDKTAKLCADFPGTDGYSCKQIHYSLHKIKTASANQQVWNLQFADPEMQGLVGTYVKNRGATYSLSIIGGPVTNYSLAGIYTSS
ncbi:hypothetical protein [Dongshaea marina]|uniref:hypothetical protein n=1 Tax=Dongshaea marina TaxID=2047966 RepID=UPI000D3ED705|nr:hypothetical protein [Dongshaea marina]